MIATQANTQRENKQTENNKKKTLETDYATSYRVYLLY